MMTLWNYKIVLHRTAKINIHEDCQQNWKALLVYQKMHPIPYIREVVRRVYVFLEKLYSVYM